METIRQKFGKAIREGKPQLVESLLQFFSHQDLVSYRDPVSYKSLFHQAAEQGRLQIVQLLFTIFDINITGPSRTTALMLAASNNHLPVVKFLLERGARVNATTFPDALSALHYACRNGHNEVLQLLYQYGASIFNEQQTPAYDVANATLKRILTDNRRSIVYTILAQEANKRQAYREVLFAAIKYNNVEIVELLLDRGVSIETRSTTAMGSHTPLLIAVRRSLPMVKMVKLLLDRGADVHSNRNPKCYTALHYAAKDNKIKIMQLLLEHGADINAKTAVERTPLHVAVRNTRKRATRFLLRMGADVNREERAGWQSHFLLCHREVAPAKREEHLEVAKVVVRHIVKMQSEGLAVNEKNLEAIGSDEALDAFQASCREEIERMRGMKFADSYLTLFDVFKADDVLQLAAYAKNGEVVDYLTSDEFHEDYPIYSETVWKNFDRGVTRKYLQARVCNFFMNLFTRKEDKLPKLPATCVSQIFGYLNNDDFTNLRMAYY